MGIDKYERVRGPDDGASAATDDNAESCDRLLPIYRIRCGEIIERARSSPRVVCIVGLLPILVAALLLVIGQIFAHYCPTSRTNINWDTADVSHTRAVHDVASIAMYLATPRGRAMVQAVDTVPGAFSSNGTRHLSLQARNFGQHSEALSSVDYNHGNITDALLLSGTVSETRDVFGYDTLCQDVEQRLLLEQSIPAMVPIEVRLAGASSAHAAGSVSTIAGAAPDLIFGRELSVHAEQGQVRLENVELRETARVESTGISSLGHSGSSGSATSGGNVRITNVRARNLTVVTESGQIDITNISAAAANLGVRVRASSGSGHVIVRGASTVDELYITTSGGSVDIEVDGRTFNGVYHLQSGSSGALWFSAGSSLHESGPPCSRSDSWRGLPLRAPSVSASSYQCQQGQIGWAFGQQRLVVHAEDGDVTVMVSSEE